MSDSLDLTRKVDQQTRSILASVARAAGGLGIPLMVIGATARDLVFHHFYDAPISRATQDLDFAIQVADWNAFETMKRCLLTSGFTETSIEHRMNAPGEGWIDLVPFGPISPDGAAITWPPKGEDEMTILGFREAYEHAPAMRISNGLIRSQSRVAMTRGKHLKHLPAGPIRA